MKKIIAKAVILTSEWVQHFDNYSSRFSRECIEDILGQVRGMPVTSDWKQDPIGKIINAKIVPIGDNKIGIEVEAEFMAEPEPFVELSDFLTVGYSIVDKREIVPETANPGLRVTHERVEIKEIFKTQTPIGGASKPVHALKIIPPKPS